MKDIATVSRTNEILDKYNLKAKKKFGQNFLIDANTVEKIAKNACDKDHITIEIGPGIGSLTQKLAKYSKEVISYEIDSSLIPVLKETLGDLDNVTVIEEDFLNTDLGKASYHDEEIVVAANLPYYITTPILFKLFESDLKIKCISVMVQKEVADRFKASVNSKDYNALSVIVQHSYDVSILMNISKNVFNPKPNVDSAVIVFKPKTKKYVKDEKEFYEMVKMAFTQRRKTLFNNLKEHFDNEKIKKMYETLGLKDSIRAQEIDLDTFIRIYEVLYED
ncbi:MAG: 16S rRNA (adenine(1518)-N(6)/adenine(1519)-N(6))-dimethyltransferase RsmA [Firmicutes bacterium]|nr:16S rRNA (adenine(1518)-N(6)/adenine(1519)-N(6))-dimethyltransferase RsmA [Bacillota bacterium]